MFKGYRRMLKHASFRVFNNFDITQSSKCSQHALRKRMLLFQDEKPEHEKISFEDAMMKELELIDEPDLHFGLDKNYKLIYVVFPNFTSQAIQQKCTLAILELLTMFPNQRPKKSDDRHCEIEDVDVYHLMEWSPKGHYHTRCISQQSTANGRVTILPSVTNVRNAFFEYRRNLSALIRAVDENEYVKGRSTIEQSTDEFKDFLQSCIEEVFLGSVINTGRCLNHRDFKDVKGSLSALSVYGTFSGAEVCIPEICVMFPHIPTSV
ncbi:hypothetical protein AKO1_000487 [Acrasis kona]|uniref:Uncharacterized protein n=1 Tax=Acrasis kona TaxID=1008807 RepID=A0AAW2Z1E7_9EUKA